MSASRNDDGSYAIDPAELQRWTDVNPVQNANSKRSEPQETPNEPPQNDATLRTENDGLRAQIDFLVSERNDLRKRLDRAEEERREQAEERRRLTALLTDQRPTQPEAPPATPPKRRWRLFGE